MIIVLKANTPKEEAKKLVDAIKAKGLQVDISKGARQTVMGLVGNTEVVDVEQIQSYECVDKVMRVEVPYKRASRAFHPQDSVIPVGNSGVTIGGKKLAVIAGPCSIETPDQIEGVAYDVAKAGANILRGGAFKPRTSPYSFQGLGNKGLDMLRDAGRKAKLPVITEIMSADKLPVFLEDGVDIIQIGARNMQNFDLLRELGKLRKPILLKRGLANTLKELLMSAEYIMASGNEQVILCERGIRTFDDYTRNTLDLAAVPMLHELTHLPVIVDPSHATGINRLVAPMAMSATACNADGLIIEVHNDPIHALCDGAQSLRPEQFDVLMGKIREIRKVVTA